ncbi:MFS transporter [Streptomyces sp. NPDC093085]|uniref:MFS transporter n=1 Tax=Streptomyces sp. NPDC093085 TaxID=3155068 RepID=UPI003412A5C2
MSVPVSVLAVAAATFSVVTTEMLPVGLLTPLGEGLGTSPGTAGLAVTLPGLVAALAAPLLPVAARSTDRRTVLRVLLLLLAAANVLSALAPSFGVLLLARALVGVCVGGVWAVAAGLAVRLVGDAAGRGNAGRATAVIYSGTAVASVLGVPAGTVLGALAGWRWAFGVMAGLALGTAGVLAVLPPLPPRGAAGFGEVVRAFRTPGVPAVLVAAGLLVTGHFAAYTYVRPALERVTGIGPGAVGWLLLGYGAAALGGTFLGGSLAARAPRRTLLGLAALLAATVLLSVRAAGAPGTAVALLLVWGVAYGGVPVSAQSWLMTVVPERREAGSALFTGVFNAAIALGALLGGRAVDHYEVAGALALGGALAVLALGLGAGLGGLGGGPAGGPGGRWRGRAGTGRG